MWSNVHFKLLIIVYNGCPLKMRLRRTERRGLWDEIKWINLFSRDQNAIFAASKLLADSNKSFRTTIEEKQAFSTSFAQTPLLTEASSKVGRSFVPPSTDRSMNILKWRAAQSPRALHLVLLVYEMPLALMECKGLLGKLEVGGRFSAFNYTLISTSTPQGSSSFMRASIVLGFEL